MQILLVSQERKAMISWGIEDMEPHGELFVRAKDEKGDKIQFQVILRLDSAVEIEYYLNGGYFA